MLILLGRLSPNLEPIPVYTSSFSTADVILPLQSGKHYSTLSCQGIAFFSHFSLIKKLLCPTKIPSSVLFPTFLQVYFPFFGITPNETDSALGLLNDPSGVRLLLPPAPPAEHQLLEPRHLPPQGAHHDAGGVRLL